MRKHSFLFLLAVASQMGATKCGQVLRDPGFDLWCGEELCAWKLERGEVKRVPTWHEGDAGVELVGTDVAITQLTPVNSGDGTCLRFELVANVEDNTEVYLDVDVQGDGTLEMHERIPTSRWKPLSYNFALATPYDGIRFEITKRGAGQAVLANIGAQTLENNQCAGLTPLDPGPRRAGARCSDGTQCASGICGGSPTRIPGDPWFAFVCLGCDATSCGATETCGLGDAFSPVLAVPVECVATASKEIGEHCIADAECGSNICVDNVCSSCRSGCGCHVAWERGPYVCAAGASGAPCGADTDCTSGKCNGAIRSECDDKRPCTSPAACPFGTGDTALQNGACTTVGIQGGSCQ